MQEKISMDAAHDFEAKMPLSRKIPLGLQHVFAMFVGNLTPLLIIMGACGIAGGEFADLQVSVLQNAMFVAGVVTLVQLFPSARSAARCRSSWVQARVLSACSTALRLPWAAV